MVEGDKSAEANTSANKLHISIFTVMFVFVVLVFVYFVCFRFEHIFADLTAVPSGTRKTVVLDSELNSLVLRCIEICEASKSVEMNFDNGLCLNDNLQRYSCAVIVDDRGHCPSYFKGVDEIVLNENCKYMGIYKYKGGEG